MTRFLDPYRECIHDTLRIVAGYAFMLHGLQKLFGVLGGQSVEMASLFGVAALIEAVGGALIAIGLYTRAARVHRQRRDGRRLLHGPRRAPGVIPVPRRERRRAGSAVLFCLPVLRDSRSGRVESRRGVEQAAELSRRTPGAAVAPAARRGARESTFAVRD